MYHDIGRFAVILSVVALAALSGGSPAEAQALAYSVIDLGTLHTGRSNQAFGINLFDEPEQRRVCHHPSTRQAVPDRRAFRRLCWLPHCVARHVSRTELERRPRHQ